MYRIKQNMVSFKIPVDFEMAPTTATTQTLLSWSL